MKQLFFILNLWGLMLFISSCSSMENSKKQVPLVKIDTVETAVAIDEISYPGIIKPKNNLSLAFKIGGQLANVLDQEGIRIKKGDLIASIDAHDHEVQFEAAKAAWIQAKKEFARITELHDTKTVAPNDFEKAEAVFKQVEAKYQAAKDALSYTQLYAPFDGYIQCIYHHGKEIVQAGTPIVEFINANEFEVEINIPVRDYKRQRYCKSAKLHFNDLVVEIQTKSINKEANVNQLYKMRLTIPQIQSSKPLTAGMNCQVVLSYEETAQNKSAHIPLSAIRKIDGESSVWKVNNEMKVRMVPIQILKIDHTGAIVTGLDNKDEIVITGVNELSEGQIVEKMPSVTKTNIGNML